MALNFPSSPTANDSYSFGDRAWIYNGHGWELQSQTLIAPANVTVSIFNATANGLVDTFDLGFGVESVQQLVVSIDGVLQPESTYSVNASSNTITFNTTPVDGEAVRVLNLYTRANTYIINDGSVTPEKLSTTTNTFIATTAEASALALAIALG
jgi:hypothetical protein